MARTQVADERVESATGELPPGGSRMRRTTTTSGTALDGPLARHRRRGLHRHEPRGPPARGGRRVVVLDDLVAAGRRAEPALARGAPRRPLGVEHRRRPRPLALRRARRGRRRRLPPRGAGRGDDEPRGPARRLRRRTSRHGDGSSRSCGAWPTRRPLLFTSTNKVYGALPDLELVRVGDAGSRSTRELARARASREDRPLDFCTPYGCSKGARRPVRARLRAARTGSRRVVFRMSCIYGPHQHGNEDQGWVAHFLIRALDAASRSRSTATARRCATSCSSTTSSRRCCSRATQTLERRRQGVQHRRRRRRTPLSLLELLD